MGSLRLILALAAASAFVVGAGAADARVDRRTPTVVISLAVPAAASATFATTTITPSSETRRPEVSVVGKLPSSLAIGVRLGRRRDGRYLMTSFLVTPSGRRAAVPARVTLRIRFARRQQTTIAPAVESWPGTPISTCVGLAGRLGETRTALFAGPRGGIPARSFFELGTDFLCDRPANAGLMRRLGLPTGTWRFERVDADTIRGTGAFNVAVSGFFFAPVPDVARITCPAGLRCGLASPRPAEPIALYQGRAAAEQALATELDFGGALGEREYLDVVERLQLVLFAGPAARQIGPIGVSAR